MIPFYEYRTDLIRGGSGDSLVFPLHLHGGPELFRVRKGEIKICLHTQEYLVKTGDLVIIFPNVIHSYQSISQPADTLVDLLVCGQDVKNGFPQKLLGTSISDPVKPVSAYHPDVDYLFSALLRELQENTASDNPQIIEAYLQLFWLRLLPQLTIHYPEKPVSSDLVTTLIAYITEHFCEPLSLEQLSHEMGICRFYLSRIFTQVLHTGFYEYVNTLRIDYAKKILLNNQDTILDVAIQCGFQNQQTFNRVFKEICGMTPTAYRRQGFLTGQ